jgi:peptidoglycan/xylan/chitin deacetylase (PgdA/CDA1 family)
MPRPSGCHLLRLTPLGRDLLLSVAALGAAASLAACGGSSPTRNQAAGRRTAPVGARRLPPEPVPVRPYRHAVPVLMYHKIEHARAGAAYPGLFVSTRRFRAQMRWLAGRGFEGVTLERVEDAWRGHAKLPRRPIVVSFDDGYRSVYKHAFPVLRRLGWPAVLNLAVENLRSPDGLSPRLVRRLIGSGWELASHTISHVDLTTLRGKALRRDVTGSRRLLRRRFHVPVRDFAYPAGLYDHRAIAAVRAAGYRGAETVQPGLASRRRPFELARIRVDGSDRLPELRRRLAALLR